VFDKTKGFVFANIWQSSEHRCIHVEIILRSGLMDSQAAERMAILVMSRKRGKMAGEVCSWKSVLQN
jgi:CspA family cold shock protein